MGDNDKSGAIGLKELEKMILLGDGKAAWETRIHESESGMGFSGVEASAAHNAHRKQQARTLMKKFDKRQGGQGSDGKVTFEEFEQVMKSNPALARTLMPSL